MSESTFAKQLLLWLSVRFKSVRVFRNNTGMGWAGEVKRLTDGSIHISNPRPLRAGLCEGSSDYIGWKSVTITPDMVGQRLARFVAIETKRSGSARRSPAQVNFLNTVKDAGGIGLFASTNEEVEMALNGED